MDGLVAGPKGLGAAKNTIDTPFLVIDDFLPADIAKTIRRDIETYFATPNPQNTEMHQIWNYRFVQGLCAYFRTTPGRIVRQEGVRRFADALQELARDSLGLRTVSWPILTFYLPGCYQRLHSDPANGRIGYIYSLTSETRQTQGGQTLVFNDGDPVHANFQAEPTGSSFCTAIEPAFNRLVLFDTRAPHSVEQLTGGANPFDGRFDFQGYISESPPVVEGALEPEEALSIVGEVVNDVFSAEPDFMSNYNGPLCLRIDVDETGAVSDVLPLLNRVMPTSPGGESFAAVLGALQSEIRKKRFPKANGPTKIVLPVMFGGFLSVVTGGKP